MGRGRAQLDEIRVQRVVILVAEAGADVADVAGKMAYGKGLLSAVVLLAGTARVQEEVVATVLLGDLPRKVMEGDGRRWKAMEGGGRFEDEGRSDLRAESLVLLLRIGPWLLALLIKYAHDAP